MHVVFVRRGSDATGMLLRWRKRKVRAAALISFSIPIIIIVMAIKNSVLALLLEWQEI